MAIFTTSVSGSLNRAELEDGEDLYVAAGAVVSSYNFDCIISKANTPTSNHRAIVAGSVVGQSSGLVLGFSSSDTNQVVDIRAGGEIIGFNSTGVAMIGTNSVFRSAGYVFGGETGLYMIFDSTGPTSSGNNTGTIESDKNAVVIINLAEQAFKFSNSGTIEGRERSFSSESGANSITNTGKMIGSIQLGYGNDFIDTSNGTVKGAIALGNGNDTVYGSAAADTIRAGNNNDTIRGNGGNDKLYGDGGNDTLDGGTGNDTLEGGSNLDRLTGGTGNDLFRFTNSPSSTHLDTITDFKHGQDKIALTASKFAALGSSVTSDEFGAKTSGHAAADNQHIIYDKSNGTLWYDADDNGSEAAVQFATLSNKPADLSYSDFIIV